MTYIRVGLIGSGSMARTRAATIAATTRATLVAVTSRNSATGSALAASYGCDYLRDVPSLLARRDLDAVIVCTHNAAHGAQALAALESGRHALVEYPLALGGEEAERTVARAARRRLALQVGYDQEFLGPHEAIRGAIAAHGRPLLLEVRVHWPGGSAPSPFRNARVGGSPAQAKSYYLYAALDWLDAPATEAARHLQYAGLRDDGHYEAAVERVHWTSDAQHVQCIRPTAAQLTWVVGPPMPERQRVSIELTWPDRTLVSDSRAVTWRDAEGEHDLGVERHSWATATQQRLERFLDEITGGVPDYANAERARVVARVLDGASPLRSRP